MSPQARLIVAILLIMTVFAIGTVGYMVIERDSGITFSDAAYMTVITVSTVGFGEVWHLSPLGRLWTVGTIVFGIATVSYAFTSLIALIVGGELKELRESRKMEKTIEHLDGHVIICGFGRIGVLVADELKRRSTPFIVIEHQRSLEFDLREAGVPYLPANAHVRRKSGAMVVAIKRADGGTLTSPETTTIIQARDTLILVGPVGVSSRLDRIDAPE